MGTEKSDPGDFDSDAYLFGILFSFEGRIPRITFFLTTVTQCVVFYYVGVAMRTFGVPLIVACLVFLSAAYLAFAQFVKRFHDLDKSGWWSLVMLVPLLNLLLAIELYFSKGTSGPNRFGHDPVPSEREAGAAESTSNTEQTPIIAQSGRPGRGSSLALEIKAKSGVMESKPEPDRTADKTEPNPVERKRRSFNPFLIKAEGPRRLSIAILSIALVAWFGFAAAVSKGFQNGNHEDWLITFAVPLAAYLVVLLFLRIIIWVVGGFRSGQQGRS